MKAIKIKSVNETGMITLNGVAGFLTSNDGKQIQLIYSSGMSSIFYDPTKELMDALNEKFGS